MRLLTNLHRHIIPFVIVASASIQSNRGQDFNPTVVSRCMNGFLSVSLRTETAFQGVIYADGHRGDCFKAGIGLQETIFNLPLTAIVKCGISYDSKAEQYFVLLHVREHLLIILEQDRMFNVSCPRRSESSGNVSRSNDVEIGIFSRNTKVHRTVFGDEYSIKIWSNDAQDFIVSSCMGFAGYNNSVDLTDYQGCAVNGQLMSNFIYFPEKRMAEAKMSSMFKFPKQNALHLQCTVVFCETTCSRVDCERRRDDPISLPLVLRPTAKRNFHERFTSTTVLVDEVGNATAVAAQYSCQSKHQLMTWLAVLFGFLFLGAVGLNCVFCALSGTCCWSSAANSIVSENVEFVTTDLKAMDAIHSATVRNYPSLLETYQLSPHKLHYQTLDEALHCPASNAFAQSYANSSAVSSHQRPFAMSPPPLSLPPPPSKISVPTPPLFGAHGRVRL